MARTFVGLAMSSTMFQGDLLILRRELSPVEVREILARQDVVSCVNPSHKATVDALKKKFGIEVPIPDGPAPKIVLEPGDSLLVLSANFKRRLAEGEKYSPEEVEAAQYEFALYQVAPQGALGGPRQGPPSADDFLAHPGGLRVQEAGQKCPPLFYLFFPGILKAVD